MGTGVLISAGLGPWFLGGFVLAKSRQIVNECVGSLSDQLPDPKDKSLHNLRLLNIAM